MLFHPFYTWNHTSNVPTPSPELDVIYINFLLEIIGILDSSKTETMRGNYMIVNITSKQMDITPAIREHIENRLTKLDKWQVSLINTHVVLSKEPQGFMVDANIKTATGKLVASAKHEDMYVAINELINKLERQLNKVQHKGESRRANNSVKEANLVTL